MHVLQEMKDKIRKQKEERRSKHGRSGRKRLKQDDVEIVAPAEMKGEVIELSDSD